MRFGESVEVGTCAQILAPRIYAPVSARTVCAVVRESVLDVSVPRRMCAMCKCLVSEVILLLTLPPWALPDHMHDPLRPRAMAVRLCKQAAWQGVHAGTEAFAANDQVISSQRREGSLNDAWHKAARLDPPPLPPTASPSTCCVGRPSNRLQLRRTGQRGPQRCRRHAAKRIAGDRNSRRGLVVPCAACERVWHTRALRALPDDVSFLPAASFSTPQQCAPRSWRW